MRFSFCLALLGALGLVATAPSYGNANTNAARLARGLPLKAPSLTRRNVLRPRQSGSANPPFNVAGSPTAPQNSPRKRDSFTQGYLGVSDQGNVVYSTSPSDSGTFLFDMPPGSSATASTLFWTASRAIPSLGIVAGQNYVVIAHPLAVPMGLSPAFQLVVGPVQDGDVINYFQEGRYGGDLHAMPQQVDNIWFAIGDYANTQSAFVGITNDFNSIVAYQSEAEGALPQEILVQAIPLLSSWTNDAVYGWYQKGLALVNPVMMYGQDYTTQVTGYVKLGVDQMVLYPSTPSNAAYVGTTFYMPLLNSGQSQVPLITMDGGVLYTIYNHITSDSGVYTLEEYAFSDARDYAFLGLSGFEGAQYGLVNFGGTIFGLTGSTPAPVIFSTDPVANGYDLELAAWGNNQPICMERLAVGATPTACSDFYNLAQSGFINFGWIQPMALYIYDNGNSDSGYWTLNGPVQEDAVFNGPTSNPYTYFYLPSASAGSSTSTFQSFYQGQVVGYYPGPDGSPLAVTPDNAVDNPLIFNLPNGYSATTGGIITTTTGNFYYQFNGALTLVIAETTPSNARLVCVEAVPPGGTPHFCADQNVG